MSATSTLDIATPLGTTVTPAESIKSDAICDTQPVTAEGIRNLLRGVADLKFLIAPETLQQAAEVVRKQHPSVLILDKGFGIQAVLDWLVEMQEADGTPLKTGLVVWGVSVTEAEALRFLQAGARGILRKSAGVQAVISCLRTVAAGRSWMEDTVFRDSTRSDQYPYRQVDNAKEQQVLELVEQGFKNKEIATELGIRPGTVKIHLKHIFEKTGVQRRWGPGSGRLAGSRLGFRTGLNATLDRDRIALA